MSVGATFPSNLMTIVIRLKVNEHPSPLPIHFMSRIDRWYCYLPNCFTPGGKTSVLSLTLLFPHLNPTLTIIPYRRGSDTLIIVGCTEHGAACVASSVKLTITKITGDASVAVCVAAKGGGACMHPPTEKKVKKSERKKKKGKKRVHSSPQPRARANHLSSAF